MKQVIRKIFGELGYYQIRDFWTIIKSHFLLLNNFFLDAVLYYKHSNVFKKNTLNKLEALVILKYHSLEKGLLHNTVRYKFGRETVIALLLLLQKKQIIKIRDRSQISSAYLVVCKYYELHVENNVDISDYFSDNLYSQFKSYVDVKGESVLEHNSNDYFENNDKDFYNFSKSRHSVRDYCGELIDIAIINRVIDLAKYAPSVCNRQPVKVYYIDDKVKVDNILEVQGGLKGYDKNIYQLLVVVADRNYFYTVGERNQLYIDGGIFLMNLLYALHFYNIAACPAHWGMNSGKDKKIAKQLSLDKSEKVISLVSIGLPSQNFKTCKSNRRSTDELLRIVK
jgi:nitroreductase